MSYEGYQPYYHTDAEGYQHYYQADAAHIPMAHAADGATVHVAFDRLGAYNFLCIVPSVIVPCLAPLFSLCARKHVESQKCEVNDRRVEFEAGWLNHSHKSIPLDRIQDVNVRQDCIQKCFGIKSLEIQTAGTGSLEPEATLIAPMDATMVRDAIMERRDALILGRPGAMELPHASRKQYDALSVAMVDELRSIKASLQRLEQHVEIGVTQLQVPKTSVAEGPQ